MTFLRGWWQSFNKKIGEIAKKGCLGQFEDLRGGAWQERAGGVFEGRLIPQCTLYISYKSNDLKYFLRTTC